jgi:AMP-polyphosphate phosphotransferase
MFDQLQGREPIDAQGFKRAEAKLRKALLSAQHQLKERGEFPVIALFAGLDGAGKGETVNLLNEWMDPRLIATVALDPPTREERARPRMYRHMLALPERGRIGLFFGGWYGEPLTQRFERKLSSREFRAVMSENLRFEQLLLDDGAVLLKFWLHLSEKAQRQRLKRLAKSPLTAWRVGDAERAQSDSYGRFVALGEEMVAQSNTPVPWLLVDGENEQGRTLTVARALLEATEAQLARTAKRERKQGARAPLREKAVRGKRPLDGLDLTRSVPKAKYEEQLERLQGRLNLALRSARFRKQHALVAVFEGNDAAGKGGAIRRVAAALDARQYETVPIAAPSEEERLHHYLWRFWRRLPTRGELTIFDRSWYGRVLVERVEGLASPEVWQRAYGEINDFETQLVEHGFVVAKFWLAISKEEQLRRFREREETEWKRFKITPEDYRNRERWGDYVDAVNDMVERTNGAHAPWTLVEATDKRYARLKVLETLAEAAERVG